jgi:hypothetical protein
MSDPALTVSKSDPNYWKMMYNSLSNEKTYWKSKAVELQATITELKQGIQDHIAWSSTHIDSTDLKKLLESTTEKDE